MPKIPRAKEPVPGARSPKAPNYGRAGEKEAHENLDEKYHHGGRTETPDEDVNPAKKDHVEADADKARRRPDPGVS